MHRSTWSPLGLLLVSPTIASAQVDFELHVGPSFPAGDYADDSGSEPGFASTGASVIANVAGPFSSPSGLEWVISGGVVAHGVQHDLAAGLVAAGATDVSVGRYLGVPLLTGLRYRTSIGGSASLHFDGQLTFFVLRGPDLTVDGEEITHDFTPKVGFAIGGGIDVNSWLGVGFRVVPLGEIEGQINFSSGGSIDLELPVTYFDSYLAVGIP